MKVNKKAYSFDALFINSMQKNGITILRITLGIVYVWFGLLKILEVSPVATLVTSTYPSFPEPSFIIFLGIWEVLIGIGLICKIFLRVTLALLWLQMAGIFFGLIISPSLYFINNNPLLLNTYGEFVIKNIVLVAASIVVGGFVVKKKD
jgi:uncharacterized membrane protein YkgB